MSMFDYDARPVTPLPVIVGTTASRGAYAIRDFLSRNGYPFEWVDAGQPDAVRAVLGVAEVEPSALPLCVLPDGSRLASATVEQVAAGLGMVAAPARSEYDLTIVGAGPAGLGAAVNAASEGLRTVVVEAVAPGGQAGTTSMIENLLGFPDGISGSELATRAVAQARRFGAELLLARPLADVSADGPGYVAELSDGTLVRGRAVLLASGVEWRRLEVPGIDDLLGAGVYYGAGPSEALACAGSRVAVVGGGNSAGQAVVRFSRYARQVTLLVRGRDLGASMSQYLIDHLSAIPNVEVRVRTQVVGLEADDRLRALVVRSGDGAEPVRRGSGWPPTRAGTWSPAAMRPVIRAAGGHWIGSRCRWRPICPACSPLGTCAAGRSNVVRRPLARDQWPWRSSTAGWRRWVVTEPPAVAIPEVAVPSEFAGLASDERIATAAAALERNGIRPLLAATGADARGLVRSLLTDGAEVYNNTSQTLEAIGVADDIERSGRYQPLRLRLYRMDREMQRREMRTLAASPDYVVGSVHALTEDGSLLIASASGSQLGPLVSGAAHVIFVIGAQKIVSDSAAGMRRIYEYCYPLEDARAQQAYGVPSGVNNILIINKVMTPGRVTAIIVNERLGF
jgi:thioredoxin reductase (NADPH)